MYLLTTMKCKKKRREGKIIEGIHIANAPHDEHNIADVADDEHDRSKKSSVAKEMWHQTPAACSNTIASDMVKAYYKSPYELRVVIPQSITEVVLELAFKWILNHVNVASIHLAI